METLQQLLNVILHLDQSLTALINLTGNWSYAILFAIIFCETGILPLAFLPGDSLLFATGAFSAYSDILNIHLLFLLLLSASVLGNSLNYFLGRWVGPQVFKNESSKLFNPAVLERTHQFCERYGSKAIILARFIPIIRTFAPFVVGVGYMLYQRFFIFNLLGGLIWIGGLLYGSYLFGNIPLIHNHFGAAIIGIILISLIPAAWGTLYRLRKSV